MFIINVSEKIWELFDVLKYTYSLIWTYLTNLKRDDLLKQLSFVNELL